MNEIKLIQQLKELVDLRSDTEFEKTDESIRQNSHFKSANAWTLIFAIFIASVGLNINSTAVIIGAMLISPLMGPIVGAGYALGVNDFELLKECWINILIAMGISIGASMFYFLLSPIDQAQSELLARTSPTFYDVIIAAFGGSVGIIAMSRKEKSNAIPGVAIATALMPPLCTAGYAISKGEWSYLGGALYLFIINSVFITLSTYTFVRFLQFKKVSYANKKERDTIRKWIIAVVLVVIIPSVVSAWLLLQESRFSSRANNFINNEIKFKGTFLVDHKINYNLKGQSIELSFVGEKISKKKTEQLDLKKKLYQLDETTIIVNQVSIDDKVQETLAKTQKKELDTMSLYQKQIGQLEAKLSVYDKRSDLEKSLEKEIQTFRPELLRAFYRQNEVTLIWKKRPLKQFQKSTETFIKERFKNNELFITHSTDFSIRK